MNLPARLALLRVRPLAGTRARGWLTAGPLRFPCALGPAGIVRLKREGDKGTPAGRFRLVWGYYRPDRPRPQAGGVPVRPMRPDQGWCEDEASPRYNRPVRLPAADCTDRMWRDDHLYDLIFVLDQNFSRRSKGRGSAIFFHLARPGLAPTAGCVAISAPDMRKLAPRLARGAVMEIGYRSNHHRHGRPRIKSGDCPAIYAVAPMKLKPTQNALLGRSAHNVMLLACGIAWMAGTIPGLDPGTAMTGWTAPRANGIRRAADLLPTMGLRRLGRIAS